MRAVLSTSGEPKAVLVTGGAGFTGSHLVRRLLSYEYRVRVLDNFATGKEQNLSGLEELEVVTGDIRSRADVARSMRGMNAVFHLAALPSRSEEHTSELQSRGHLVCRLLLEKKKKKNI